MHDISWSILDTETDRAMVALADCPETWHENYIDHLNTHYFSTRPCRTAVDAGASYGWMSLGFAQQFDQVHAFELRQDVFAKLTSNMAPFPHVQLYNHGLGSETKLVDYPNKTGTGTTSIGATHKCMASNMVKPLDSLSLTDVDFIKIDVEGYELEVLRGAEQTIAKWHPLLLVEIHTPRSEHSYHHRQAIFTFLRELGYSMVDVRHQDFMFVHESTR